MPIIINHRVLVLCKYYVKIYVDRLNVEVDACLSQREKLKVNMNG